MNGFFSIEDFWYGKKQAKCFQKYSKCQENPRFLRHVWYFCIAFPVFFFVYKGTSSFDLDDTDMKRALKWALGLGGGLALITIPTALPYIKKRVATVFNEDGSRVRVSSEEVRRYLIFEFYIVFSIKMLRVLRKDT